MSQTQADKQEIALRNDRFRRSCHTPLLTVGVLALNDVFGLISMVRRFSDFSEANDPYGEHDFGSFVWQGVIIFWKIDYYDERYAQGVSPLSEDCHRVLTIMTAGEY